MIDDVAHGRAGRQIGAGLGLAIATPDDAQRMLGLKGGANVAFWSDQRCEVS
jgi:hypothetical protein